MYLAFRLAIAPLQRKASLYRIVVSFQPLSKILEFCYALCIYLLKPGIQIFTLPLSQHGRKVGDEFIYLSDLLISLTQLDEVLLLPVQTLFLFKGNPMSYLGSRWRTPGRNLDRGWGSRINLFESPGLVKVQAPRVQRSARRCYLLQDSPALLFHDVLVGHFCTRRSVYERGKLCMAQVLVGEQEE